MQVRKNTVVRRRQIVSAARKLIVRYGSEHVTVRRIAREIGVSEGAIYRHFKSKREILSFLIDEIEEVLMADIEPGGEDSQSITSLQLLESVLAQQISSVQQRSGISFQIIAEIISFGDKKLNKKVYEVINEYISRIKFILQEGIRAGNVRADIDLDATAIVMFGTVQGLVNLWALSNYTFDLEERCSPVLTALLGSLKRHS